MVRQSSIFTIGFFLVFPLLALENADSKQEFKCDFGQKLSIFDAANSAEAKDEKFLYALLDEPLFRRDDEKYIEALIRLEKIPAKHKSALVKLRQFVDQADIPSAAADRERRGNALIMVRKLGSDKVGAETFTRAGLLLQVDLAETSAAKELEPIKLSHANWLKRIEVLSDRNENKLIIDEITDRKNSLLKKGQYSCRVQYLYGRALRKNRSYRPSMEVLSKVSKDCQGPEARNAAYLLARQAAILPEKAHMKHFSDFEKKYSSHSYFDDVLLFKSSAQEDLKDLAGSRKTLERIAKLKSNSDMRFEAIFRLAFSYALEGKASRAIEILDEALASEHSAEMSQMEKHRINYWSARLHLYDDIYSLKRSSRTAGVKEAVKQLEWLANTSEKSFYSWLARNLLKQIPEAKIQSNVPLKAAQNPALGIADFSNKLVATVVCLAKNGYEDYARRYAELISPYEIDDIERLPVARMFSSIGLYEQVYRFAPPDADEYPTLMYPKAFAEEVSQASAQIGIPENLIFGIMREESRFNARAISWAGARGLLQLMPSVALSEASRLKMKKPSTEDMMNPSINVTLGALHLKGMLDGLKHPLFAVAAYNAGFSRAKNWESRFKDIKALDTFVESIPISETRNYVKRVASSWVRYSDLYSSEAVQPDLFSATL